METPDDPVMRTDAFEKFSSIFHYNRFLHTEKDTRFLNCFLDYIKITCKKRITTIEPDVISHNSGRSETVVHGCEVTITQPNRSPYRARLFRAQKGSIESDGFTLPYGDERMRPFTDKAREGRANPSGIPCFYAALDDDTAKSEVRPPTGSPVTEVNALPYPYPIDEKKRGLNMVDCTIDIPKDWYSGYLLDRSSDATPDDIEQHIWGDINEAFSRYVSDEDIVNRGGYVPTQAIAEAFHLAGYSGIMYNSAQNDKKGINIAVFFYPGGIDIQEGTQFIH